MTDSVPDLSGFRLHKVVEDIDFEGVAVPGLTGCFYRGRGGARQPSMGLYRFAGREVFRAWGYVGERHCRASALVAEDGTWDGPHSGCPEVRVHRRGEHVIGFAVRAGASVPRYHAVPGPDGPLPSAGVPPHTRADGSASGKSPAGAAGSPGG